VEQVKMYIERHEHGWEPDILIEQLNHSAESLEHSLVYVTKKPGNLSSLMRSALNYAGYLSVLEPNSTELKRTLTIAANAIKCIFLLADRSITEEYDLYVGEGAAFSFPQTGSTSSSGSGNWQEGYYLAFACREKRVLDVLVRRSTDIMRQRSEGVNEYSHLMVDALKSFYSSYYESEDLIQETSTKLRAAINATDGDKIIPLTIDGTINFALPAMELVAALLEGNVQNFNESLADALECHKKYWSSDEQLSGDPRGFIAIAPLGLACAAYDAGFPIEVESEYIPKYILERQFLAQQKAS
jgi:Immunity protein 49